MRDLTIQDKLSNSAYALNTKDAEMVLGLVNRILEDYDLPELTPEEAEELDRLEAEDTGHGVPLQDVLAQYGVDVE